MKVARIAPSSCSRAAMPPPSQLLHRRPSRRSCPHAVGDNLPGSRLVTPGQSSSITRSNTHGRPNKLYLRRDGAGRRRVVFLGMNPGPLGMVQTGVPLGRSRRFRDRMGIEATVEKLATENPKRRSRVLPARAPRSAAGASGDCSPSVSGLPRRSLRTILSPNYCPLASSIMGNLTPDKLLAAETAAAGSRLRRASAGARRGRCNRNG